MSTQVAGVLRDPFERPLANTDIDIRAITNTFAILPGNTIRVTTNSQGEYNFILEPANYAISVILDGRAVYQGAVTITSTTPPGTIPELLKQAEMLSELPLNYAEYFQQVQATVKDDADRAQAAADSIGDELDEAKAAAAASQASAAASEQSNQQSQAAYQSTKAIADKFTNLDEAVTETQQNAQQTSQDAQQTAADRQAAEDAAQRAENAAESAETVNERNIRVPQNETINALPAAADRASSVSSFDASGQSVVLPLSQFAILDSNGKVPLSKIPAAAITEVFPVSSIADMLALTADPGDVAIVNNISTPTENGSYILMSSPASNQANWKYLIDNALVLLGQDDGYTRIPSVQIQRWKDAGDIRGWGAKCDGVTDDISAINQAISDTGGKILIPKNTFVSTHIVFKNLLSPQLRLLNGAFIVISTAFIFNASYRGIVVFDGCQGVDNYFVSIVGAKVDKTNAAEPWQDGDAGIEFVHCTGTLNTYGPKIRDVKTWGIIHVECPNADSRIFNPEISGCQVQSGIGGTGYRSLTVINPMLTDIGLYGIELETRNSNKRTAVIGGMARLCNKGFATVHNSDNVVFQGVRAVNCNTGFSFLSDNVSDEGYRGDNQMALNCVTVSCGLSYEMVYPRDCAIMNGVEGRSDLEYYVRTRALDRIVKFSGSKAYVALDSASENPGITANMVIQMDDGTQFTVATVDSSVTTDSVFGNMIGFTTSSPMSASYLRSAFRRYRQIQTGNTSVVLYGGDNVTVKGCNFSRTATVLASYGNHNYLNWEGNTTYNCASYFAQGTTGTVSGSIKIETGQNQNLGGFGDINKFSGALRAMRLFTIRGGSDNAQTSLTHSIPVESGFIGTVKCALNPDATTTGTIVFKLNGNNTIAGGFSGSPLRASAVNSPALSVNQVLTAQLVDTVGDLKTSGYAVELYGAFM